MYNQPATTITPALVIYLIDASKSMNEACGSTTKIDVVNKALRDAMKDMVRRHVRDWHTWSGVLKPDHLTNDYAKLLFSLSSPLPESYRENINNHGYHLQSGAALFFPGASSDLVRLAFAISSATQLK